MQITKETIDRLPLLEFTTKIVSDHCILNQKDNYDETTLDKAWSRLMDRDLRRYVNLERVRR